MPFRALRDGELVVPAMVPDQDPVACPACGETMYAREGANRARHFYHVEDNNGSGCLGVATGESSTHARCVALAVAALKDRFDTENTTCAAEVELDVSMSGSCNKTRRADAIASFDTANEFFGKGVVVEVQHRNHSKDVKLTTHDYLSAGYSVAFLSSEAFKEEELNQAVIDEAFSSNDGVGYSIHDYEPTRFISCESYWNNGEHSWRRVPSYVLTCGEEYEICVAMSCSRRRKYDESSEEYIYDPEEISPLDLPVKVLKEALPTLNDPIIGIEDPLKQRYGGHVVEKAIAARPEIGECVGPKGFHEWYTSESVWENQAGQAKVELWRCRHCSSHLLTDLRGRTQNYDYIIFEKKPDPEWDLPSLKADPYQCDDEAHGKVAACPTCGLSFFSSV